MEITGQENGADEVSEVKKLTRKQIFNYDREQKRDLVGRNEEFKKKRDGVFGEQDVDQANEVDLRDEVEEKNKEFEDAEEYTEGRDEFDYLKNKDGVVSINDETRFSNGAYLDGKIDLPAEEIEVVDLDQIKEEDKMSHQFRAGQTFGGGNRIGGHKKARGVR